MRHLNPPLVSSTIENHIVSLGGKISTFKDIAASPAYKVSKFSELRNEVAKLSISNPSSILFYRGQKADYQRDGVSTILPSIYRAESGLASPNVMKLRWQNLKVASSILVEELEKRKIAETNLVKRRKAIQWSILQHYEAAFTPYVDITQSLRVAASFALMDNETPKAFIYVFALPYYTNRVSRNSEEEITNIRLLSICPPEAKRPYMQEGFLVGEEDVEIGGSALETYDLRRRLIAKFEIPNTPIFWDEESQLTKAQLYPQDDIFNEICKEVGRRVAEELPPRELSFTEEEVFSFISYWRKIERKLVSQYGEEGDTIHSLISKVPNASLRFRLMRTEKALQSLIHSSNTSPARLRSYITQISSLYKLVNEEIGENH